LECIGWLLRLCLEHMFLSQVAPKELELEAKQVYIEREGKG
jgi:hypothetical protein